MLRMRNLNGAMLMLALLLSSCTSGALQVTPTSPPPIPTSTPPTPQQLRVTNRGALTLSHLRVRFPDETVDFGDVPPGATSAYHTFARGVYRYAAYDVTVGGKAYQQPVVDWVGEHPMEGSVFTYLLDVNPSSWQTEGQVIRLLQVSVDSPATAVPLTPASGASVTGRVVAGYGNHQPIASLPLRLRRDPSAASQPWDTTTDANGYFTLRDLPLGEVDIDDDHLSFHVTLSTPGQMVDLGELKYPLIHPPNYYYWKAAPLADPHTLLQSGKSIAFTVCAAQSDWVRLPAAVEQAHVFSRRPFVDLGITRNEQPAMLYDTIDLAAQSYPGGLMLDGFGAEWLYRTGLWIASNPFKGSACAYDPDSLDSLLKRDQLEIWLFGYRAIQVQLLDKASATPAPNSLCDPAQRDCVARPGYHYAVQLTPAPGYQVIRFAGQEDVIAIHLVLDGKEIQSLP